MLNLRLPTDRCDAARPIQLVVFVVLVLAIVAAPAMGQQASDTKPLTRVHVVALPTPDLPALLPLAASVARTSALNLRSLGRYQVTEVPAGSYQTAEEYLDSVAIGTFDRLLTIRLARSASEFSIAINVIDPLSREVLLAEEQTAANPLDLLHVTDVVVEEVHVQVPDRRIAFGSVTISIDEWGSDDLGSLPWDQVGWIQPDEIAGAIVGGLPPVPRSGYTVRVNGEELPDAIGKPLDVLIGSASIQVQQARLGGVETIYETTLDIREGQQHPVEVTVPVVSEAERDHISEFLQAISTSRSAAASRDAEALIEWTETYDDLYSYASRAAAADWPLGAVAPFCAYARAATEVEATRLTAERTWRDPDVSLLTRLEELRGAAPGLVEALPRDFRDGKNLDEMIGITGNEIVKLAELAQVRDVRRRDWGEMERRFRRLERSIEQTGFVPPPWFTRDAAEVGAIFDRYREEDPSRNGLYASLSLGGMALMATGATMYTSGVWTALEYQAEQDSPDLRNVGRVYRQMDEMQAVEGGTSRSLGVGTAIVGMTSFIVSSLVEIYDDVTRADRLLRTRLQALLAPRMAVNRELDREYSREDGSITLPLADFE